MNCSNPYCNNMLNLQDEFHSHFKCCSNDCVHLKKFELLLTRAFLTQVDNILEDSDDQRTT